ncbi:MAG: DUF962 domain-containing protein [Rhodospirillales bacterium]|nr:DUF962 domain-containing protein [Rhodospirillales bacterium]
MGERITSYRAFWPYYLREHSCGLTRLIHVAGTGAGLLLLLLTLITQNWWLLLAALLCGYGFAWISHLLIERNRPATFTYPLWSFVSDLRMCYLFCLGRLDREVRKHGISSG